MKKQKGFVIPIIIAIVAISAIGGGYYYTQKSNSLKDDKKENVAIDNNKIAYTTDETKDWKIYKNEEYGFEFKYPNDWEINEDTSYINLFNPNTIETNKPDTDQFREAVVLTFTEETCLDSDWKTGFGLIYYKKFCISNGSLIVNIDMGAFTDKIKTVEDKILSTFKFITPISQNTDWENYTNEQLITMVDKTWSNQAMYPQKREGKFLIVDQGTGPYPRRLIIYDLNTKDRIFSDSYSQRLDITNVSVNYWSPIEIAVTVENCPESINWAKNGLGAKIESHVSFSLLTLTKKELGEQRCSATQ